MADEYHVVTEPQGGLVRIHESKQNADNDAAWRNKQAEKLDIKVRYTVETVPLPPPKEAA